jgi:hypothetical protein
MSGGAYDYLCNKDAEDAFDDTVQQNLRRMADRLAGLGYAEDAARETEELICMIAQAEVRVSVRMRRLSSVWRSVEWWDSCDSSEDYVRDALAEYRKAPPWSK